MSKPGGTMLTSGTGVVIDATTPATAQGTLIGGGTILANVGDNGLVDLTNGQTLVIDGPVSGTGSLLLDGGCVLQVREAIAPTIRSDFDGGPARVPSHRPRGGRNQRRRVRCRQPDGMS
jgi:hypothetical protein